MELLDSFLKNIDKFWKMFRNIFGIIRSSHSTISKNFTSVFFEVTNL